MKNKHPIISFIDITEDLSRYLSKIYKYYDKKLENKIVVLSVYNASKQELKDIILENPKLNEDEIFFKYEKLILQRTKGLTNMTAITRETGVPRTTVNRVVKKYLEQDVLRKKNSELYIGKNFRIKFREFFDEIDKFYNAVKNKY
jgi:hypothetical protein